ncbi:hypothetical protein ACFSKW_49940 [Nonomuraea mangrovi]|uniref:Uncharacterized protein n=1 Tax=Nonomuraea mangrovi TaxID=2316207 RepID=A0ABW4TF79_9ACTN
MGINVAVQDAVATANVLGPALVRPGAPDEADAAQVQSHRQRAARITQAFQLGILRDVYPGKLTDDATEHVPPIFTAFRTLRRCVT